MGALFDRAEALALSRGPGGSRASRAWAAGLFVVLSAACGLLEGLPDLEAEASPAFCSDGLDNDFDGMPDCRDPSCSCNRCGEPLSGSPPEDGLGRVCERDCECPEGSRCNLGAWVRASSGGLVAAGRCLSEPSPEDEGFDVHFALEVEDDRSGGPRNVQGAVRLGGAVRVLTDVRWDSFAPEVSFTGSDFSALTLQTWPPLRPSSETTRYRIDDAVVAARSSDLREVFLAYFAEAFEVIPPGRLPADARAMVETATLTFAPLDGRYPMIWRGRLQGRLRPVSGFDRAKLNPCREPNESFEPSSSACRRVEGVRLFFGCPLGSASEATGRVAYALEPWSEAINPNSEFGGEGECRGLQVGEVYRIRARTGQWLLDLEIPRALLGPDLGLTALDARFAFLDPDMTRVPLFEAVGLPPARDLPGARLWIDVFEPGAAGRVFGWLISGVPEVPP